MKNFRKVLALVMVVATLLSFATVAGAEYKDQASITAAYEPAVDVLTALGILQGEKSGDQMIFRPADEIDRDEVAKMVAVLHNGGDDIEMYYSDACTFADTKDTWAAGYVAYCYHTGIIAGRNATTFDPDASITGYEVAKMLLCTMGFNAEERGYVNNADWKVNIMSDAKNFGLLEGLNASFNLKNNIKREEVAQMMFTVLSRPVVLGSVSSNIVNISNSAWIEYNKVNGLVDGGKIFVTDMMDKIDVDEITGADDFLIYGNVVLHKGSSVGDLFGIHTYDVFDEVGRPYKRYEATWIELTDYIKGQKVEYYWFKDYPYAPIATSVAGSDKFTAHHLFIDGEYFGSVSDSKQYKGENGMILETYNLGNEFYDEYVVVALNTTLGVVTEAGKWQGERICSIDLLTNEGIRNDVPATELAKIENVDGLEKGDVVLVNYYNDNAEQHYILEGDPIFYYREKYSDIKYEVAATAQLVEPEMVYVSRVASNGNRNNTGKDPYTWTVENSKFYSGKDEYEYHYNVYGYFGESTTMHEGDEDNCFGNNDLEVINECYVGDTYAVYRANGYVIGWLAQDDLVDAEANWNYAVINPDAHYVPKHTLVNGEWQDYEFYLDNVIDFNADRNDNVLIDYEEEIFFQEDGALVRYIINKDGEADEFEYATYADTDTVDLAKGELGERGVQMNSETKFLAKIGEKYEAATGYKAAASKWGKYVVSEDWNIQYFADEETGVATYVYMDVQIAREKGYFYIIDWVQTVADVELFAGEEVVVEQYAAIVDGELVKLWVNSDNFEEGMDAEDIANGLYDVKGVYLTMTLEGEKIIYVDTNTEIDPMGDAYMFDSIDDDKVWYKTSADSDELAAHVLADDYNITVLDYAWVDYDESYGFSSDDFYAFKNMTQYKNADAFNDEFHNNYGYGMEYFAAFDGEGYVTDLYILRVAYHKDDTTSNEIPWN